MEPFNLPSLRNNPAPPAAAPPIPAAIQLKPVWSAGELQARGLVLVLLAVVCNLFLLVFFFTIAFFMDLGPPLSLMKVASMAVLACLLMAPGAYLARGAFGVLLVNHSCPVPTIRLTPASPSPGSEFVLTWTINPGKLRPSKINLGVESYEITQFSRGRDSVVRTCLFWSQSLISSAAAEDLQGGSVKVQIPSGLMHSFGEPNHGVGYRIICRSEIPRWPDQWLDFRFKVAPEAKTKARETAVGETAEPVKPLDNPIQIRITGDQTAFLPGDTVEGQISWNLKSPTKELAIRLVAITVVKDASAVIAMGSGSELPQIYGSVSPPSPEATGEASFKFALPTMPYSFKGDSISLKWAIEAESSPKKVTVRSEFVMSSDGRPIVLVSKGTPRNLSTSVFGYL